MDTLTEQDLSFVNDQARRHLLELSADERLSGMNRALVHHERISLAYYRAFLALVSKRGGSPEPLTLLPDSNPQEDDYI